MTLFCLILAAGLLIVGCNTGTAGGNEIIPDTAVPELEFPFGDPDTIVRFAAFDTPNWSGTDPHNGIDMVVNETLDRVQIIAPVSGTISSIQVSYNPFSNPVNQLMMTVGIKFSNSWEIALVLEPSSADPALTLEQSQAVAVTLGQKVKAGDEIGSLLIGTEHYPHLHYMVMHNRTYVCAYDYSTDSAKQIFDEIAQKTHSKYKY